VISSKANNPWSDLLPVKDVVDNVTEDDIDTYSKRVRTEDQSYKLRTVVAAWKEEQDLDRGMRRRYGWVLLSLFGVEILLAGVLIFLIGFRVIELKEWIINVFFVGVFTQTSSLVIVVVKYLFPEIKIELLKLINQL